MRQIEKEEKAVVCKESEVQIREKKNGENKARCGSRDRQQG